MRAVFFFLFTYGFLSISYAQLDGETPTFDGLTSEKNAGFSLDRSIPSLLDKNKGGYDVTRDTISLAPDKQPNFDITNDNNEFLDPKIKGFKPKFFKDAAVPEEAKRDKYLGDFTTKGKFVTIYCRDHQFVDGDRVKIIQNSTVLHQNVLLTGRDRAFIIDLEDGFNQLDFVALNQGSSGPNTAQFKVYDENGNLLASNIWNLATGATGTLIVVKE